MIIVTSCGNFACYACYIGLLRGGFWGLWGQKNTSAMLVWVYGLPKGLQVAFVVCSDAIRATA